MGFARTLATIVFILALPIALITTNVRLLLNAPAVYDYAFDRYNAEDATGLSRDDLDATAKGLREYFNNDEKTFFGEVTEGGLTGPVFNARETLHMEDVKRLVVWTNRIQEISIVYVLAYVVAFVIWARDGDGRQLARESLMGIGLGTIVAGVVGIFAIVGFDATWERFHEVVFPNNLWRLNPRTDHLIQMFPEKFWRDMTILLGVMSAIEAVAIAAVSSIYLASTRRERRKLRSSVDVSSSVQAA